MLRKIVLSLTLFLSCSINAVVYLPQGINIEQVQTSKKEIAWDIHNVLAQKEQSRLGKTVAEFKKYFSGFRQAPQAIITAAYDVLWAKITGKQNPASLAMRDMKNLPKSADASGEAYMVIFDKHNLSGLSTIVQHISNAYRPRPGMEQIVNAIAKADITQRLASNIGPSLLEQLKQKFANQHQCMLFDRIQQGKIVDYSKYGKEPNKNSGDHLSTVGKPDLGFFEDFNITYNRENTKRIIFIDDKLENVKASIKKGWVGIHFNAFSKNNDVAMAQLEADLLSLGVL